MKPKNQIPTAGPEVFVMAFANISSRPLDHLQQEVRDIREALVSAEEQGHLTFIEHSGVTYTSLANLRGTPKAQGCTMFHYSGHSSAEGLVVEWKDEVGNIATQKLVTLLSSWNLRFVFLNGCYSAQIAEQLVEAGIWYVVGTTDAIRDASAVIVARKFYKILTIPRQTVQTAFELTQQYFSDFSYNGDKNVKDAFRHFTAGEKDAAKFPWQLQIHPELGEQELNWKLVPEKQRHLVLSGEGGKKYKLRVLCVHDDSTVLLYEIVKNFFAGNNDIVIHNIQSISPREKPLAEDLISECEAADVIIHLLTDKHYMELWNALPPGFKNACRSKRNIGIKYSKEFKVAANFLDAQQIKMEKIFPEYDVLCSIEDGFERRFSLNDSCSRLGIERALDVYFRELLDGKYINPEKLRDALYEFDFTEELRNWDIHRNKISCLIALIEGTSECAQNLLYKKLRFLTKVPANIPRVHIEFSSVNGNIVTEHDLYAAILNQLFRDSFLPPKIDGQTMVEGLQRKLQNEDVVILFDNIGEASTDASAITVRQELLKKLSVVLGENLQANLPHKLFIFAINRSLPGISFRDLELFKHDRSPFDKIQVQKLSMREFISWHTSQERNFASEIFKELYDLHHEEILQGYRENSMGEICIKLVGEENKDKILTKVLDYEHFK